MKRILSMKATRVIAFAATAVQAVLTGPFFISFAYRVYIEGVPLSDSTISTLLDQSIFLGRHTAVWIFSRHPSSIAGTLTVSVYKWTEETIRPYGEDIGLQCTACGGLSCRKGSADDQFTITVKCESCTFAFKVKRPEGQVKLKRKGEKGIWTRNDIVE